MIQTERHERILDLVARRGAVAINELARLPAASASVVRKSGVWVQSP